MRKESHHFKMALTVFDALNRIINATKKTFVMTEVRYFNQPAKFCTTNGWKMTTD